MLGIPVSFTALSLSHCDIQVIHYNELGLPVSRLSEDPAHVRGPEHALKHAVHEAKVTVVVSEADGDLATRPYPGGDTYRGGGTT